MRCKVKYLLNFLNYVVWTSPFNIIDFIRFFIATLFTYLFIKLISRRCNSQSKQAKASAKTINYKSTTPQWPALQSQHYLQSLTPCNTDLFTTVWPYLEDIVASLLTWSRVNTAVLRLENLNGSHLNLKRLFFKKYFLFFGRRPRDAFFTVF